MFESVKVLDNPAFLKLILQGKVKGVVSYIIHHNESILYKDVDLRRIYDDAEKNSFELPEDSDFIFRDNIFIEKAVLEKFGTGELEDKSVWVRVKHISNKLNYSYSPYEMMDNNPDNFEVAEEPPQSTNSYYYKVETDETNVYSIIAQHYAYAFDKVSSIYKKLDEETTFKNLTKGLIRKAISVYVGDVTSIVSDNTRLIHFLLSKVKLTTEEKEAIYPLTVSMEQLAGIGKRTQELESIKESLKSENIEEFYDKYIKSKL